MLKKPVLVFLLMLSLHSILSAEEIFGFKLGRTGILLEMIGLNYLPLSINIPLTKAPIPKLKPLKERDIYGHLLTHIPRILVLEASTYPLPVVGLALKHWLPEFYDNMELWTNFNLIESVTVSFFEEPWAVSLFFGNVVEFDPFGEARDKGTAFTSIIVSNASLVTNNKTSENQLKGRGYSGLLFSYGNKQIKHNQLIPNDWLETELKLIGSYSSDVQEISWSYRLGARFNWNPEINSLMYLGLKRDRLDKKYYKFAIIQNSMIEFEVDFDFVDTVFHKVTLVLGKKFPLPRSKLIPEINLGFTWKFNPVFQGSLQEAGDTGFAFVISPNVRF